MIDQDKLLQTGGHASNPAAVDLGPLAWVVDSLRDTLHNVGEQLSAFSQEVAAASGSHITTLDTTALRMAAQSLHEAVGVLDVVERPAAAKVVGAMERCVQLFITNPELCVPEAAQKVSQASTSVLDYLSGLLKGQPDFSPGLFPAYQAVAQLAHIDRIHPADLWHAPWQWLEVQDFAPAASAQSAGAVSSFLDGVLQMFRSGGTNGAEQLAGLTQQLWQKSSAHKERVFWQLAGGLLQLQSAQALDFDDQLKRLLSRIAVQYDLLQQQSGQVSERLAQDVLYFIALGHSQNPAAPAPLAQAIAQRYQLDNVAVSGYKQLLYGTVDPAMRQRLRESISTFKDLWSDVSAGNTHKMQALRSQTDVLLQSLNALWPAAAPFSGALQTITAHIAQSGQAPHPDVAMEVATAILFLEASAEDTPADSQQFDERIALLAQRLEAVQRSEQMEPPTEWMETLYARLNDQSSLEQVVAEARTTISEVEQALDDFFRHPQKTDQADESSAKLDKIAGVLLALNYEDASKATTVMSRQVQQLVEASRQTGSIDALEDQYTVLKLGNSLGTLSFMLDMMVYQPALAKAQFYFDEETQELAHRNVAAPANAPTDDAAAPTSDAAPAASTTSAQLGQTHIPALDDLVSAQAAGTLSAATATEQLGDVIQQAELAGQPALAQQARQALDSIQTAEAETPEALAQAVSALAPTPAAPALPDDGIIDAPIEEEDLRDIFLEEAAEVIGNALSAIEALHDNMADTAQLTNLRRAFHTLKGSGRMVGLASFGEAAWEMERTLNGWLADAKPATQPLLQLATDALEALSEWRESIARQEKTRWHHAYFSQPAAAMQESGTFVRIAIPDAAELQPIEATDAAQAEPTADAALLFDDAADSASDQPLDIASATDAATQLPALAADAPTAWHLPDLTLPEETTSSPDAEQAVFADEADTAKNAQAAADATGAGLDLDPAPSFDELLPAHQAPAAQEPDVFADEEGQPLFAEEDAQAPTAPSPAEEAAPALQLSQFIADLPSLDLDTPAADTPSTAGAAEQAEPTEEVSLFAAEDTDDALTLPPAADMAEAPDAELLFADELADTPAAAEETPAWQPLAQTSATPTPDALADTSSTHDTAANKAPEAFAPAQDTTLPLTTAPADATAHADNNADAESDDSLIHNALAGMLVDTTPQLAVLQDMVSGLPDEEIKHVGDLRIPLALFNTYLNEADVWSRQLQQELSEWVLDCSKPLPHSCGQLAHSLAGSSAAVGMGGLASMSRGIEHAADRIAHRTARPDEAQTLQHAAEMVRQALHQFAAGLRQPTNMALLCKLAAIVENIPLDALPDSLPSNKLLLPEQFSDIEKKNIEPADVASAAAASHIADAANEPTAENTAVRSADADNTVHPAADAPAPTTEAATAHIQDTASEQHTTAAEEAAPATADTVADEAPIPARHAAEPTTGVAPATAVPAVVSAPAMQAPALIASIAPALADAHSDVQDAIDPDLFDIFRDEAHTLLQQLNAVMRQWIAHPDNTGACAEAQRLLHTFKGGARLAGAMQLGAMVHEMESRIGDLGKLEKNDASVQALEQLQAMLDEVQDRFTLLLSGPQEPAASTAATPAAAALAAETPAVEAATNPAPEADASNGKADTAPAPAPTTPARQAVAMPISTRAPAQHGATQAQVRVRSNVLDRMLGSTGEVMISRARLEAEVQQLRQAMHDMDGSLDRLRAQLRDMELQAETQMQSRMAQSAETRANFDPLEFDRFTRVQELTRMMAESVNDVASVQRNMIRSMQSTEDNLIAQARQARELQEDLLKSRMVEFDSLSERLYRVVRQAAKETGKQVALNIVGAQTAMDRDIIERIASPFEHLLRNAVVHGIEAPEQRAQAGKEPTGHIEISLAQEGNDVAITVRDDGKGLDVARIREKAIAENLLAADAVISDEEAMQLIFQSGLTTSDQVTSLAGRGVGMDVVRTEINALGGRIETTSRPQAGTTFTLVLPLTTAVTQVVEVQAGELRFGVPSSLIEAVRRTSDKEVRQAYENRTFTINGENLPFYWAGAMLQSSPHSAQMDAKRQVVLVLRSAAQRIVMHIDNVVGNHEVVVKNIGPQLARMPGLSGVTVLPDGSVLFIYNPVALSFSYAEAIRAFIAEAAKQAADAEKALAAAPVAPLVLVVDDSITVRRVTGRLLQREGYRIASAADGVAALREIANERPAVVLSDIEMPQMDGFDLLRHIRSDEKLRDLPVILITSRTADKHREHAAELGATGFLGKPYSEDVMLDMLRQHTQPPAAD